MRAEFYISPVCVCRTRSRTHARTHNKWMEFNESQHAQCACSLSHKFDPSTHCARTWAIEYTIDTKRAEAAGREFAQREREHANKSHERYPLKHEIFGQKNCCQTRDSCTKWKMLFNI